MKAFCKVENNKRGVYERNRKDLRSFYFEGLLGFEGEARIYSKHSLNFLFFFNASLKSSEYCGMVIAQ